MGTNKMWHPPEGGTVVVTYIAGADLSAKQFHFVKLDSTAGQVVLCGNGEAAIGILINAPESGELASVVVFGRAKIVVADTSAHGAYVDSDANGQATTKAASTTLCSARLIPEAGVGTSCTANDIVDCIFVGFPPIA